MPNIVHDIKRIIDSAFQRKHHNNGIWTLQELVDYIGEKTGQYVSERTVMNYIARLRADGAPLKNIKGIGYKYVYDWSLSKNPLTEEDIKNIRGVINILKQYKGFRYFNDIEVLINKLNEKVAQNNQSFVLLDVNNLYKGLEYCDDICFAISEKKALDIQYRPFYETNPLIFTVSPIKLIEYNNRWYIFGHTHNSDERNLGVYALDRIINMSPSKDKYKKVKKALTENYFNDIIGVTNYTDKKKEKILFKVYGLRAKYIETKPIHSSLKIERREKTYILFSLHVKINPELEAFLLNLGSDVEIVEPLHLKNAIKERLQSALNRYL
ncbi:MAG: hypothetical protein Kow0068_17450 [Marinilabiliales bacterium]